MLFDVGLLFLHTGTAFSFSAGEYVSMVGVSTNSASSNINLGHPQDMGIGSGVAVPKIACLIGTAITSSSAGMVLNIQFQGSSDSVTWTTYNESGTATTASYLANTMAYMVDVPRRPAGVALPQYYRLNLQVGPAGGTASISTGTMLAGIVIDRGESGGDTMGQYPSGFSVV